MQLWFNIQKWLETRADKLLQQGNERFHKGKVKLALYSWQRSLIIYQLIQTHWGEMAAWGSLGNAYHVFGKFERAIKCYRKSLAISQNIRHLQGKVKALGSLGITYIALGDYAKAIECCQQALKLARIAEDKQAEANTLGNLGIAYDSVGEYTLSIEYYQQQLAIAQTIKDDWGKANALIGLGSAYYSLEEFQKAIEFGTQALEVKKLIKDYQGQAKALGNLGLACQELGNSDEAIKYYQEDLKLTQLISDRQSESNALGNLAMSYCSQGKYQKANGLLQRSLEISRSLKDLLGEGSSLNNLAIVYLKNQQLELAENSLFAAIKNWEKIRLKLGSYYDYKVSFFDEQIRSYENLQKVLIVQNKTELALEIAERGRTRTLVELLVNQLSDTIAAKEAAKFCTIGRMKEIAREQNATIVEYSVISYPKEATQILIWAINPTGELAFRQVEINSLEKMIRTTREYIAGRNDRDAVRTKARKSQEESLRELLQQLYNLLIHPIAEFLPKTPNSCIIFVPQSFLFFVPFPALQDTECSYLIEKYTVLTAPSIQILDLARQKRDEDRKTSLQDVLILGNPTMPSVPSYIGAPPQPLRNLPGAEEEAKAIASFFGSQAIIGNSATKAVVVRQMERSRIVHLATHGLLNNVRALESAIALAPSDEDSGLLTAEEILKLNLKAELVVLSACDTGRGRLTGDGVIGLSRSLISAGVPTIIVSLWAIPDSPTAFLMTQFYQNLQQNLNKAQALRQAMLTTAQQYPHPRNWAAFTLIGERV